MLLLLVACGSAVPAPPAPSLVDGLSEVPLSGSVERSVTLKAGEVLHVGALSGSIEVSLAIQPPTGDPRKTQSSHADHRAANLRFEAAEAGVHRIRIEPVLPSERGGLNLIRRKPMTGSICDQLTHLSTGDSWALPGVDLPSDDASRRTRTLVEVAPWAEECTVNRLGDMDVGPSCRHTGSSAPEAVAVYAPIETEFRACHVGWTVTDESEGSTKELVAEKGGALHFVRLRDEGDRGWQVSAGAMPSI